MILIYVSIMRKEVNLMKIYKKYLEMLKENEKIIRFKVKYVDNLKIEWLKVFIEIR